jgi:hypothetical protein
MAAKRVLYEICGMRSLLASPDLGIPFAGITPGVNGASSWGNP